MLIPLRMAPEIVMIVEDQDPFILTMLLLIKIRSRQSAEPATNNNQVVGLGQFGGGPPIRTSVPRAGMGVLV